MATKTKHAAASARNGQQPVATRDEWLAAALHRVMTPSGVVVLCRIPDLPTLMLAEAVPEHLRGVAVEVLNRELRQSVEMAQALAGGSPDVPQLSEEEIVGFAELKTWLAARMVVEPEVTEDDFRAGGLLPKEDAAMLVAIATRERDTDALGRRLGVVELRTQERFLREYECSPGCPSCKAQRDAVSARSDREV